MAEPKPLREDAIKVMARWCATDDAEHTYEEYVAMLSELTDEQLEQTRNALWLEFVRRHSPLHRMAPRRVH